MNLNDLNDYKVIAFKISKYYSPSYTLKLRDIFFRFTKDGVKPIQGIQELFLLTEDDYNTLLEQSNGLFKRDVVRSYASHSFTVKGYLKLK